MSSSGSDSGDEDYVPSDADSQPPSEVDSDGEEEDLNQSDKEEGEGKVGKKKGEKRERNGDTQEEEEAGSIKKKSESLWSDFLKQVSPSEQEGSSSEKSEPSKEKEVVTQVYEFAGEKVTVSKEVAIEPEAKKRKNLIPPEESEDGKREGPKVEDEDKVEKTVKARKSVLSLSANSHAIAKPRFGGGGSILSSALDKLGKKNKLSTLEKSKLDWESYKSKEGICEEITSHNKGKLGYLDKRDFLDRTDLKQYELEKQLRNSQRSKR